MQIKPADVLPTSLSALATDDAYHGDSLVTSGETHRSAGLKDPFFDGHRDEKATLARLITITIDLIKFRKQWAWPHAGFQRSQILKGDAYNPFTPPLATSLAEFSEAEL